MWIIASAHVYAQFTMLRRNPVEDFMVWTQLIGA